MSTRRFDETFDAVLVKCGIPHPRPVWLDALCSGGRMIAPITAALPGTSIGKGQALVMGQFPRLNRLRRDPHDESGACWLHGSGFCLSA